MRARRATCLPECRLDLKAAGRWAGEHVKRLMDRTLPATSPKGCAGPVDPVRVHLSPSPDDSARLMVRTVTRPKGRQRPPGRLRACRARSNAVAGASDATESDQRFIRYESPAGNAEMVVIVRSQPESTASASLQARTRPCNSLRA